MQFSAILPRRSLFSRRASTPASIPNGRRIYAIGDIHGRLDLLNHLLSIIAEDQRGRAWVQIEIILLGDLIDRGPDSAGVIQRAMLSSQRTYLVALMGNHEAAMLQALRGDAQMMEMWLEVGGVQALESYGIGHALIVDGSTEQLLDAARAHIPADVLRWVSQMPQSMLIGDYYFVHAGVRPNVPLDQQTATDSFWIRDVFLRSRCDHGAIIVHGHSIAASVEERPNRIGLDTGAYQSGRLTALGLEGSDRWYLST